MNNSTVPGLFLMPAIKPAMRLLSAMMLSAAVLLFFSDSGALQAQSAAQQQRESGSASQSKRENSLQQSRKKSGQESDRNSQRRKTDQRAADQARQDRDPSKTNRRQDGPKPEQSGDRTKQDRANSENVDWTPARKRQLRAFLEEHRPQLLRMMNWLEQNRPDQFQKAVAPLLRTQDRLLALKERNPEAYRAALDDWKLDTDIQIAAARVAVKDTPPNRKSLRDLLERKQAAKLQRLQAARERLKERVASLNAQIHTIQSDRAAIDRAMNLAVKRATRLKAAVKPEADGGAKKSGKDRKDDGKPRDSGSGKGGQ